MVGSLAGRVVGDGPWVRVGVGVGLLVGGVAMLLVGPLATADRLLTRLLVGGVYVDPAAVAGFAFAAVPGAALAALLVRGERLALDVLVVGLSAWLLADAVIGPLGAFLRAVAGYPAGLGFPAPAAAIVAGVAAVALVTAGRVVRAAGWAAVGVVGAGLVRSSLHTPADVVAGVGVGLLVAVGWTLVVARLARRPDPTG